MNETTKTRKKTTSVDAMAEEKLELEKRKVKSLEKIANSLDALTVWFEEIDKDSWGSRIEWYLHLIGTKYLKDVMQQEKDE